ncbi:protein yippee-like 4 isoform X2 [Myiozetetes cayanensis]|uniref:protein yippee-like 4 isoform X2 n=1 Tax=Myiozetetes cayanensis TaxID=478635 RepID=UPI00215E328C|nr:protein yippee-like 4 isoform X2 [Myiozetetes cayanensis]
MAVSPSSCLATPNTPPPGTPSPPGEARHTPPGPTIYRWDPHHRPSGPPIPPSRPSSSLLRTPNLSPSGPPSFLDRTLNSPPADTLSSPRQVHHHFPSGPPVSPPRDTQSPPRDPQPFPLNVPPGLPGVSRRDSRPRLGHPPSPILPRSLGPPSPALSRSPPGAAPHSCHEPPGLRLGNRGPAVPCSSPPPVPRLTTPFSPFRRPPPFPASFCRGPAEPPSAAGRDGGSGRAAALLPLRAAVQGLRGAPGRCPRPCSPALPPPAPAARLPPRTFRSYLPRSHRTYSCVHCRAHLARHEELISKSFQGSHGRAYLFNSVVNVGCGPAEQRLLLTGLHSVADIFCQSCKTTLGWKYAFESSQKYKEGKFIIEMSHMVKENGWD